MKITQLCVPWNVVFNKGNRFLLSIVFEKNVVKVRVQSRDSFKFHAAAVLLWECTYQSHSKINNFRFSSCFCSDVLFIQFNIHSHVLFSLHNFTKFTRTNLENTILQIWSFQSLSLGSCFAYGSCFHPIMYPVLFNLRYISWGVKFTKHFQ